MDTGAAVKGRMEWEERLEGTGEGQGKEVEVRESAGRTLTRMRGIRQGT